MIGHHRTLSFPALFACLSASLLAPLGAQTQAVSVPAQAVSAEPPAAAEARALEARLPVPKLTPKLSFELSAPRQERLQKLLPDTLRQLSQRETLHLLVLGGADALEMWTEDGKPQPLQTFPAVFARDLAAQFFYTGGVREAGDVGGEAGIGRGAGQGDHGRDAKIDRVRGERVSLAVVVVCDGDRVASAGL